MENKKTDCPKENFIVIRMIKKLSSKKDNTKEG
jgi:hypothetical protein